MQENKRRDFTDSHQIHLKLSNSNLENFQLSSVQSFHNNHTITGLSVDLEYYNDANSINSSETSTATDADKDSDSEMHCQRL